MQTTAPLQHGQFYHIYNCGINGEALFRHASDYEHFLRLYDKYIEAIADTYAWCLMGNHFHLLVRIKEKEEIGHYAPLNADRSDDSVRFKTIVDADLSASDEGRPDRVDPKIPDPSKHFSHLFNAYSRYYNLRHTRHGSLFERPFKRKRIDSEAYLKRVVIYIHNNPVHHGFCNHALEYGWSSYLSFLTEKTTKIKREKVHAWFNNTEHFQAAHSGSDIADKLERFLGL